MIKPLTSEQKEQLRTALEKAMAVQDDNTKVFIAIHSNGEGKCWQSNHTLGELAVSAISVYTSLVIEANLNP